MIYHFFIQLRNRLVSWTTMTLVVLILMMSVQWMNNADHNRPSRSFVGDDVEYFSTLGYINYEEELLFFARGNNVKMNSDKPLVTARLLNQLQKEIGAANLRGDRQEVTRLMSFFVLLIAKKTTVGTNEAIDLAFELKTRELWNDVSGGIAYQETDFTPFESRNPIDSYLLLGAKYYHRLYTKGLTPLYADDVTVVTYLHGYMNKILPWMSLITCLLLGYYSICRDVRTGSTKLLITQGVSRNQYYFLKWAVTCAHILFILVVPAILFSIFLALTRDFHSLSELLNTFNYPVFVIKNGLNSLTPVANYYDMLLAKGQTVNNWWFSFLDMVPSQNVSMNPRPHEYTILMPFYQYCSLSLMITLLFVSFATGLIQWCSALFKNEVLCLLSGCLVLFLGLLSASPMMQGAKMNLNPFGLWQSARIVTGSMNSTILMATLILGSGIFVCHDWRYAYF